MLKENRLVALSDVRPHPKNYRIHTEAQIQAIAASLKRFGQGRSIVCQQQPDETYLLIAGHGVFAAAARLGYKELRADLLPATWSPDMANGYLVADNKISESGRSDQEKLLTLLREQETVDLPSLGSSEEEMLALLESLAFDDTFETEDEEPFEESSEEAIEEEDVSPLAAAPKTFHYTPPIPFETTQYEPVERVPEARATTVKPVTLDTRTMEPDESLFRYNSTTIRQIVLIYSQEEYGQVMPLLTHLRETKALDTNTDAITHLLNRYAEEEGLEKIALDG